MLTFDYRVQGGSKFGAVATLTPAEIIQDSVAVCTQCDPVLLSDRPVPGAIQMLRHRLGGGLAVPLFENS